MRATLPILSALITAAPSTAFSFDYMGFQSGATLQEASEVAIRQGSALYPSSLNGVYSMKGRSLILSFCNGRLFAASDKIDGGVDAFAKSIEDYKTRYGHPVDVSSQFQYLSEGLFSSVTLTWMPDVSNKSSVSINSYQNTISVNLSFSATTLLCPVK